MMSTPHFDSSEFRCSHCGAEGIKQAVPEALEVLRAAIGKPINVHSGYRCARHPIEAAKTEPGWHSKGLAVDIAVKGMTARELYAAALACGQFRGFGVDDTAGYIHVDLRPGSPGVVAARWCYNHGQVTPWHEVKA